jgi:hypothetical protein
LANFWQNWGYADEADEANCNFLRCRSTSNTDWSTTQSRLVTFYNVFGWIVMLMVLWTYVFSAIVDVINACRGEVRIGGGG